MSIETSLPGGGASPISPVGVTGLVGITGPIGITGQLGVTIGNFPSSFGASISNWQSNFGITGGAFFGITGLVGITGSIGVSVSNTNFGVTGALGVSVSNFPSAFGVTGQLGVSISNTGLGVTFPFFTTGTTGALGVSVSNFPTFFSIGATLGKTPIFKTGALTTLGTSAAQNIFSYTVSGGKNFFMEAYNFQARFSTLQLLSGITNLGFAMLQSPAGTTLTIHTFFGGNTADVDRDGFSFAEPITFAQSSIINMCVSPNVSLSVVWIGNLIGYER